MDVPMTPTTEIVKALGGNKALKHRVLAMDDLRQRVRAGLPFSVFEKVLENFSLSREDVSKALGLSIRTIARRKREQRLSPDDSNKLVRLARIAAQACQVLGGVEKASRWLKSENRALGNQVPLYLLDTEIGARQIEEVLGRIEHGSYS